MSIQTLRTGARFLDIVAGIALVAITVTLVGAYGALALGL